MKAREACELADRSNLKYLIEPIMNDIIAEAYQGKKFLILDSKAVNSSIITYLARLGYGLVVDSKSGTTKINWDLVDYSI